MEKGKSKVVFSFGERGFYYVHIKTIIIGILLTFSVLAGNSLRAQDIIVLSTGEEIRSTVSEVAPDMIRYKKFENLSGPVYSIEKSKVFMIKYQNGTKDVFNQPESKPQNNQQTVQKPASQPVSSSSQALTCRAGTIRLNGKSLPSAEIKKIYEPYPNAMRSYNSGKTLSVVGDVMGYGVVGVCLISALRAKDFEFGSPQARSIYATGLIIAIPLFVGDIVLVSVGRGKIRSSVNQYNTAINKPVTYKLDFGINRNGIGFALKF
jgi:hypothetical protein